MLSGGISLLKEDMRTIKGAVFDHKGETAGLGAEITQQWFQDRFVGEKITDANGTLLVLLFLKRIMILRKTTKMTTK